MPRGICMYRLCTHESEETSPIFNRGAGDEEFPLFRSIGQEMILYKIVLALIHILFSIHCR